MASPCWPGSPARLATAHRSATGPLPANLEQVQRKLKSLNDGDRRMVQVLSAVVSDGIAAVEAACAEALAGRIHSADVILNILAAGVTPCRRQRC